MRIVCTLCVASIACLSVGIAPADTTSGIPSETSCDYTNNREYTECLGSVLSALEPILSRYYDAKKDVLRNLRTASGAPALSQFPAEIEGALASLKHAQAAWQKYRDAHCDMVAREYLVGTGKAAGFAKCMIDLTRSRIRDLSPGTNMPEPE
jgi:uncharacterized protein YecT (DUF1311 family)